MLYNYNAWKDYFHLTSSQLLISYLSTLPLFIIGLLIVPIYYHIIIPYVILTCGVLVFIMAGILFPPYDDNLFSIVTSIVVITIPILIIGISLSFLNLGSLPNIIILILFYLIVVHFSVQGLSNLKRGSRNEIFKYSN